MRKAAPVALLASALCTAVAASDMPPSSKMLAFSTVPQTAHWQLERQHRLCRMQQQIPEWGQVHITHNFKKGTHLGFQPRQLGWPEGELVLQAEAPPWRHNLAPIELHRGEAKAFVRMDTAISRSAVEALRSGMQLSLSSQAQSGIPGQKVQVSPVNFRAALGEFGKCQSLAGFDSEPSHDRELPQDMILHYATGGYNLTPAHRGRLDRLAQSFHQRADSQLQVWVEGHTDDEGTPAQNISLARKRAHMVRLYLMSKKVPRKNIVLRAHGELQPLNANRTNAERASNRRVSIQLALK